MRTTTSPLVWRHGEKLSQEAAARRVGISGKNPARTWQRWESGQLEPPLAVVITVEQISAGAVTAQAWAVARRAYLETQKPKLDATSLSNTALAAP